MSNVIRAPPDSFRIAWVERRYQDGSLTIRPGYPLRVIITCDLVLEPQGGEP